jgi:hypothetical protein
MTTIYEPLYEEGQAISEGSFMPLRLDENPTSWREFRMLVDFYRRGDHRKFDKSGIFSPKFRLKTRVTGEEFISFSDANSEADVCFINPVPTIPYFSFNVWMQGEVAHRGLTEVSQMLLDACGIDVRIASVPRHGPSNVCYSNFWVGTPEFWERYVGGWLDPIARFLEENPESDVTRAVLVGTLHNMEEGGTPYLPFIIERLFSTFVSLNPDLKVAAHPIAKTPLDYCVVDFEQEVVSYMLDEVDEADRTQIFTSDLKRKMRLLCGLLQQYGMLYHAANPHPHYAKTQKV